MPCRCGCYEPYECLCLTPREAAEMTREELAKWDDRYKGLLKPDTAGEIR